MSMRIIHKKCGGQVDTEKRKCLGCSRKWNCLSFLVTNELRPMVDRRGRVVMQPEGQPTVSRGGTRRVAETAPPKRVTTYSKWADSVPGVAGVAGRLPNWPRWARLLVTAVIVAGVALVIILVRGS